MTSLEKGRIENEGPSPASRLSQPRDHLPILLIWLLFNLTPCLVNDFWNCFLGNQDVLMDRNIENRKDAQNFLIDASTAEELD